MSHDAVAHVGGQWARGLVDVTSDANVLDGSGRWAVAIPFAGEPVCARFSDWSVDSPVDASGAWKGPDVEAWSSSLDQAGYRTRVEQVRELIAAGTVYQANICRVMSAPVPDPGASDVAGLWQLLRAGNPAPYAGFLRLPKQQVAIASASPELFLSIRNGVNGRVVRSGPIKGTGATESDLTAKDTAENVMIVDLVRNDLSRFCVPGSVKVPALLEVQEHPGLVHLVSYVEGLIGEGVGWAQVLAATFPPGSISGAPKISALGIIEELETAPREFYCGAFGWVDADTGEAELAVAIRTFWLRDGVIRFGTGAGITWGSDPGAEWRETELKAARLIGLAAGTWQADGP